MKKPITFVLVLLLALSLAACGGGTGTPNGGASISVPPSVTASAQEPTPTPAAAQTPRPTPTPAGTSAPDPVSAVGKEDPTLEEKVAALKAINGGDYASSDEPMTMTDLVAMLIGAYQLDEPYVKAMGDGGPDATDTPDSAFFDFGGGGDPDMPFMRGNLAYVVTKLYGLSSTPIDSTDAWKHLGQTGYADVDQSEHGYPGNREAIYICRQLGIVTPQISDTELGFEEPVTKAEFAEACYSAIDMPAFSEE